MMVLNTLERNAKQNASDGIYGTPENHNKCLYAFYNGRDNYKIGRYVIYHIVFHNK